MKIYNSWSRNVEEFVENVPGKVTMYACGPTVYDLPHAGHGRSAVVFDLLRKFLQFLGKEVLYASNYTDIDDKMINRAKEMNLSVADLAKQIIPQYQQMYARIGVDLADFQPRATDYVAAMIEMVLALLETKNAYIIEDDGVYFDIAKFPEYGKLTNQKLADMKAGARVELKDGKKNHQDFVLWKFAKPGEPVWEAPFGAGRPGWHIECSAMISQLFQQNTIDIHGGGEDLKFPHHECEIAQTAVAENHRLANYWVHNAFVTVNSEKMSKSLKNFVTLADLLKMRKPEVIRFYYLQVHYRKPLDFHEQALDQAENALSKIRNFYTALLEINNTSPFDEHLQAMSDELIESFQKNLENDLDVEGFLVDFYAFIKEVNSLNSQGKIAQQQALQIVEMLNKIDRVLGFIVPDTDQQQAQQIDELIKQRNIARAGKNYQLADQIRDRLLNEFQVQILDKSASETVWRKI